MDRWKPTQLTCLQEIGVYLREQREHQTLTLQALSETTHIRSGLLHALEVANVEALPEPVYLRALIKRYGETLGVSGQALLDRLDNKRPPLAEDPPSKLTTPAPTVSSAPPPVIGIPRIGSLMIGVVPPASPPASQSSPSTPPGANQPPLSQPLSQPLTVAPLPNGTIGTPVPSSGTDHAPQPDPAATTTPPPADPLAFETSPDPASPQTSSPQASSPTLPFPALDKTSAPKAAGPKAAGPKAAAPKAAAPQVRNFQGDGSPQPARLNVSPPPPKVSPSLGSTPSAAASSSSGALQILQPLIVAVLALLGVTVLALGAMRFMSREAAPEIAQTPDSESVPITPPSPPTPTPTPTVAPNALPLTFKLSTKDTSWLRVTVDGTVAYEGLMAGNLEQTWVAQKELILVAGRPDVVWISRNGSVPTAFGDEPNPKQQRFPEPDSQAIEAPN